MHMKLMLRILELNTDLVVQKLIVNEMTSENSFEPVHFHQIS